MIRYSELEPSLPYCRLQKALNIHTCCQIAAAQVAQLIYKGNVPYTEGSTYVCTQLDIVSRGTAAMWQRTAYNSFNTHLYILGCFFYQHSPQLPKPCVCNQLSASDAPTKQQSCWDARQGTMASRTPAGTTPHHTDTVGPHLRMQMASQTVQTSSPKTHALQPTYQVQSM